MTRQKLARLKLKAYNIGKRAALKGEPFPKLAGIGDELEETEAIHAAVSDGYAEGERKIRANEMFGRIH